MTRAGSTSSHTYGLLAALPVRIESYDLEALFYVAPTGWTRHTTVFQLHGSGVTGLGEDVCWNDDEQLHQRQVGPVLDLAGHWTLASFGSHLETLDLLYGRTPRFEVYRHYRRWALESAALDLALRQVGQPLHEVLGREPRPVRFVVSLRLGDPASVAPVTDRLRAYGEVEFKLDAEPSWDQQLIGVLAATAAIRVIDFKGAYRGTGVDVSTDPELYRRCALAFPDAYLEDPDLDSPLAEAALRDHRDRITWDVPVLATADVSTLPFEPTALNSKPSRLGGLESLFDFYDYCEEHGIALYGGGQAELGPGRGQAQLLASLFHPEAPNDLAPLGWDRGDFHRTGLLASPLRPAPAEPGFRGRWLS